MSRLPYQYAVLRCVPRVDREEFVNVGVLLHCQAVDFLAVVWHVDGERLAALHPGLDLDQLCAALDFVDGVCAGEPRGGGASAASPGQRFGFLKAPKSTVLQPGPVHGGTTTDPTAELARLMRHLVH